MLNLIFIIIILVLVSFIIYLCIYIQKIRKRKHIGTEFNSDAGKATDGYLERIETVLNPHLFKNILNSVQSHAFQTYFALDKLANILDYILYESKKRCVSPKEEIEFAKDLIEINKIKLSPLFALTIKTKIDETSSLYTKKVLAPLISIDLIENAFKHADLQSKDAYISIMLGFKNNVFSIAVSNKISPKQNLKKEKGGIGNITFEQRLDILYKNCYKLERIIEDNIFISHLKIDLNEYENKMFDP
ncbi:MAG: histidine kinase [Dysgonomonas mossii]|uniref:histidine kinase n=1 Tax=Dysgonomonas mossii TaxID=163665 RepID=UPI001E07D7EC|nr:histidine kinase [Dysgonomonas mossii]MBS5798084.1 histidine kinase [Dysgonomonas mossii]MBS7112590.1 histidine kinase [Dysgonomonas mossii]